MLYLALTWIHILTVMSWFGAHVAQHIILARAARQPLDPAQISAWRDLNYRALGGFALTALLTGLALAWLGGWFREGWIHTAILLWLIGMAVSMVGTGTSLKGTVAAINAGQPEQAQGQLSQAIIYVRAELGLLMALSALMVFKPF
jgi:uncharacterized membrane protein